MVSCVASDARVFDEGRTYQGLAAIKAWKAETKAKFHHTMEPLGAQERDGKIVVKSRLTGDFPGSPITLDFAFELEGDKIKCPSCSGSGQQVLLKADFDQVPESIAKLINAGLMAKIHTVEWTPGILSHPALQIGMKANWWGLQSEPITKLFGRLTDSEAMPDPDFIESFRREWIASGADVQTAGYRFANLRAWPQILDASPALLTLWPGLMLAGKIF